MQTCRWSTCSKELSDNKFVAHENWATEWKSPTSSLANHDNVEEIVVDIGYNR